MDPKQQNLIPLIEEIPKDVSDLTPEQICKFTNYNKKPKIIMHQYSGINRILHVD